MIALTDDPAGASAQLDALIDALAKAAGPSLAVERDGALTRLTGSGMPTIEIAVGDDAVTITVGSGEAARLAAVEPASSLAGEARPAAAMAALGGAVTDPSVWLDLAGIVDAVTAQLPDGDALSPERMVIANIEPLDHLVAVTRTRAGSRSPASTSSCGDGRGARDASACRPSCGHPPRHRWRPGCAGLGVEPHAWSNGPGDRYAAHEHGHTKVLMCAAGSITFLVGADERPLILQPGDGFVLPPGTRHAAEVGPAGVTCLEGRRD